METIETLDDIIYGIDTGELLQYLDSYFKKQAPGTRQIKTEASCLPGFHAHPGRKCHKDDERHQDKVVQAMGGDEAYFTTHPFARPKDGDRDRPSGSKRRKRSKGGKKKTSSEKRKPLADKWFDNTKTEALLSEDFGDSVERKQAMLNTVPEKWHDTIEFNDAVLEQKDPRIFATTESWLFKYSTTNEKTGKINQHVVYSKNHLDKSEQKKWEQMKIVAKDIGRIRSYADQLLDNPNSQNRAIGAAIHLLDITGFRIGGEKYVEESGTYGITSLEKGHVQLLSNNRVQFSFKGKAGVQVERKRFTVPPKLHAYLEKATKGRKNHPLFPINDADVRGALEPFNIRPKDLRTFKVNMLLVQALNSGPQYKSNKMKREDHLKGVVETVAKEIGHGSSISRKSYMHPTLLKAYLDGNAFPSLEALFKQDGDMVEPDNNYDKYVTAEERRFIDYLKRVHLV